MVLVAGFASCADEYKSYTPATADTDQVYFSNDLIPVFELADFTENQIVIPVTRQKTNDEITVQLGLIDESNFYTLQTKQVTFPAGASKADAIVTFDATSLEYDQYPEATIYIVDGVIDPEDLKAARKPLLPKAKKARKQQNLQKAIRRRPRNRLRNTPQPGVTPPSHSVLVCRLRLSQSEQVCSPTSSGQRVRARWKSSTTPSTRTSTASWILTETSEEAMTKTVRSTWKSNC